MTSIDLKTVIFGLTTMEDLNQIIKEIREKAYDNELADSYIIELLERNKEYD